MVQTIKQAMATGGLLLLLPFLLTACFDHNCKDTSQHVRLSGGYADWFSSADPGIGYAKLTSQTSSGLSETLTMQKLYEQAPVLQQPGNCRYVTGQVYSLRYHSSVYGNGIKVMLMQQKDGELPVLEIIAGSFNNNAHEESELLYDLSGKNPFPVTFSRQPQGTAVPEKITTQLFPVVTLEDSLVAGGRVYRQVYKVTNPYLQQEGAPFQITDFYVDKAYGLVQYTQQDGTTWQIQL